MSNWSVHVFALPVKLLDHFDVKALIHRLLFRIIKIDQHISETQFELVLDVVSHFLNLLDMYSRLEGDVKLLLIPFGLRHSLLLRLSSSLSGGRLLLINLVQMLLISKILQVVVVNLLVKFSLLLFFLLESFIFFLSHHVFFSVLLTDLILI